MSPRQAPLSQVYVASQPFPTSNSYVPLLTYLNSCKNSNTIYPNYDNRGKLWLDQYCGEGGGYSHVMTPNLQACIFQSRHPRAQPDSHPEGFCDVAVEDLL